MIMKTLCAVLAIPALLTHAIAVRWPGEVNVTDKSDTAPDSSNETDILNYALAVGNLQSAFYNQSLSQFDEQTFNDSGFSSSVRDGFARIASNKQEQVAYISDALGPNATQPCEYSFPVTNVTSFAALSQLIETVGVSAYVGGIQNLTNTTYITVASSILAANARYASWVSSVNGVEPWDGAFEVPLTPREVVTLAAPYVTSCPESNVTSPFTPYPALEISEATPGSNATLTFTPPTDTPSDNNSSNATYYGAFYQGLSPIFVPISTDDNTVTIPSNLTGLVFVVVTNSSSVVSDETIVAGPTVLNLTQPTEGTIGNGTEPIPIPTATAESPEETATETPTETTTVPEETPTETTTQPEETPTETPTEPEETPTETVTAPEETATETTPAPENFSDTFTDTSTPTETASA